MSFTLSESAGSASDSVFTVPQGTHLATLFGIVGVGKQATTYGDKVRVYLGWEVHGQRFQYKRDGVALDEPATVWRGYNVSLHPNASLRVDIQGMYGRSLSTEETRGFDLFELVGQPCQLTIEHNAYGDRTYCNVQAVNQVLSGVEVPELESEEVRYLKPSHTSDWHLVPKFLQDKARAELPDDAPAPAPQEEPFKEDSIDDVPW